MSKPRPKPVDCPAEVKALLNKRHMGRLAANILSERCFETIDQINDQMVDDETPYWAVVRTVVEGALKYADETGDLKPLIETLKRITRCDLSNRLRKPKGKESGQKERKNNPKLLGAIDYKFIRKHAKGKGVPRSPSR